MKKLNNIKYTFQVIRNLPLIIPYQQVEEWVMEYDKKLVESDKSKITNQWLSIKYKLFTWWKK